LDRASHSLIMFCQTVNMIGMKASKTGVIFPLFVEGQERQAYSRLFPFSGPDSYILLLRVTTDTKNYVQGTF